MGKYLTESSLGGKLKDLFGHEFIHDRGLFGKMRPDYKDDLEKLIVEFDGPRHYTESARIVKDRYRDEFFAGRGYRTVRIPYFIQWSSPVVKELFGIKTDVCQEFPHGFVSDDKSLVLPADFCELGVFKFKSDLDRFKSESLDILASLKSKIAVLGDADLVIPPSLRHMFS